MCHGHCMKKCYAFQSSILSCHFSPSLSPLQIFFVELCNLYNYNVPNYMYMYMYTSTHCAFISLTLLYKTTIVHYPSEHARGLWYVCLLPS